MRSPEHPHAPKGLGRLLVWVAGPEPGHAMLGDLDEEFHRHVVPRRGARRARSWYRRQVLKSIPRAALARWARGRAQTPDSRAEGTMEHLLHDIRYTLRTAAKNPIFTAVIVLTLALGIGANTIIYSVVDGLVINPFPFPDGERLVAVGTRYPKLGQTDLQFIEHISPAEMLDLRNHASSLERVVSWDMGNRQVSMGEITENVFTGFWWGNAFETLGVDPHLGRGMTPDETVRGDAVAVLSHRIWTSAFGSDPALVGSSIMMNGNPYTVVGVMPPRAVLYGMDLWIPMGVSPEVFPRERRQWQVMARIAEGHTLESVNTELEGLSRRTEREHGTEFEEYEGWGMEADTWTGANVRAVRPAAFILLGAVGFVLLLVCSNVASMLLARSAGRRREMAVRTAMGAGRRRLLGQLLTESLGLATLGGVIGIGIAWLGVRAVADIVAGIPFLPGSVEVNVRVLAFTAVISMLSGILFGLLPALQGSRSDLQGALKAEGGSSTLTGRRLRAQRVFVGIEVALALVLLAGGGLLVNSVLRLNATDPGYAADEVLTMRLTLPWEDYDGPAIGAFFQELEERVSGIPGVTNVGVGSQFPPVAFSFSRLATEDTEVLDEGQLPVAMTTLVSPGYFDALGIPLRRGRGFSDLDVEGTPMVALLNEAAAQMLFGGADPIGRRVSRGEISFEVVGVVANTLNRGIDSEPFPEVFANHRQAPGWSNQLFLMIRSSLDEPIQVLPMVREQVRQMDADQPIYAIRTAGDLLVQSTAQRRVAAAVLSIFAGFALVLAVVGIYAVVSFSVGERTREIGLRVALGARGTQVRRMMVRQALVPVAVGCLIGLAGAVAVGRVMQGLLFEVSGTDPVTLGAVGAILISAAVAASWVPASRASRLDPVRALNED